jgi:hypothetical protein
MIVQKSRYVRTHVVGGGGIFDTIANIVKRITGNTVGRLSFQTTGIGWYEYGFRSG